MIFFELNDTQEEGEDWRDGTSQWIAIEEAAKDEEDE
jgi:hypothetical protein